MQQDLIPVTKIYGWTAIIVLVAIIIFLTIYIVTLQSELKKKKKISAQYREQNRQSIEVANTITEKMLALPSDFYFRSDSCMTPNESRIFYYLNTALDEIFPDPTERSNYYIFPQVSLHSLVKLRPGLTGIPYDVAKSNYVAKSIDFVICRCSRKKWNPHAASGKLYDFYAYSPVLLIELDGQSHFSAQKYGQKSFDQQKKNDAFKNALFKGLNIPFIRYTYYDSSYVSSKDAPLIKECVKRYLTP